MRSPLLLVAGMVVGLGAGWALFSSDAPPDRTTRASAVLEESKSRSEGEAGTPDVGAGGPRSPNAAEVGVPAFKRSVPSPASEEALVRRLMREAYDERRKGVGGPEQDLFEAAVRQAMRDMAEHRTGEARRLGAVLLSREQTRAAVGEMRGSPLLLQLRVAGHNWVTLAMRGNSGPLRIEGPPAADAKETHVTGGVVPPGSTFLIERVRILAYVTQGGSLELRLPGSDGITLDSTRRVVDREYVGLVRLRHGLESTIMLKGNRLSVSVELHGRLVSEAEGESAIPAPLQRGPGEGWLTSEPVVLQVLADHGGGNPRRIHLNGALYRLDILEDNSIWSDDPRWRELQDSLAYSRGCGEVPPGKAYRITRVDLRALLDPESGRTSNVILQLGRSEVVKSDATVSASVAETWRGDLLVYPGEEKGVSLTCSYFGQAEATIYGELVDDLRIKR